MSRIFDQALALFEHADWVLEPTGDHTIAAIKFQSGDDSWQFVMATNEQLRTMTLFAQAPLQCPPERRSDMVELFNRINFGMTHGAWVLDAKDGEMRFRVGADLAGRDLAGDELGALTNYTNTVMEASLPTLRRVAAGDIDVDDAMAGIFGSTG